jgi:hypothetical protein
MMTSSYWHNDVAVALSKRREKYMGKQMVRLALLCISPQFNVSGTVVEVKKRTRDPSMPLNMPRSRASSRLFSTCKVLSYST